MKSWLDLATGMRYMVEAGSTFAYVIVGIILIALLFSIINTMLMAVMERTREIGMLMAVGFQQAESVYDDHVGNSLSVNDWRAFGIARLLSYSYKQLEQMALTWALWAKPIMNLDFRPLFILSWPSRATLILP